MPSAEAKTDLTREIVIDRATELFWREGFDGVSIGDLVEATGLNRYALYQAFGGKRDIFLAVLQHYIDTAKAEVADSLRQLKGCPYNMIYQMLEAKMAQDDFSSAGCMICTTGVDVCAKDQEVTGMVNDCMRELRASFAAGFRQAQKMGDAPLGADPVAFGELAQALYFSTGVQARMGRPHAEVLSTLKSILAAVAPS